MRSDCACWLDGGSEAKEEAATAGWPSGSDCSDAIHEMSWGGGEGREGRGSEWMEDYWQRTQVGEEWESL